MGNENKVKAQRGHDNQEGLRDYFDQLLKSGQIKSFTFGYRDGYSEYNNIQFYAPFLIEFKDGEKWIVFTSTSFRSDRIKETYWDIFNLKNLDSSISKAYFVYCNPPKEDEAAWKKFTSDTMTRRNFSPLDGVYSYSSFRVKCQSKATAGKSQGFINCALGKSFEQKTASALRRPSNLREAKKHDPNNITYDFSIFNEVMKKAGIDPQDIFQISATADKDDIGLLPTNGMPKTDVFSEVTLFGGGVKTITISCKKSTANWVSVSQYSADAMANAIDPLDLELRSLLIKFQTGGTLASLDKNESQRLTEILSANIRKFCRWVLGGIGGIGEPKTQWAYWIIVYTDPENNPDEFKFYSIDEYIDLLLKNSKGNYGTPFRWTYASGEKGNSIQLKAPVI